MCDKALFYNFLIQAEFCVDARYVKVEKTEHAGTATGVENYLKMAIGLKNTAIDYQLVVI